MSKANRIFWLDVGLFGLLILAMLMVGPEIVSHAFMHVIPGLLLMAGAGIHLWLHRTWIVTAVRRFGKLAQPAQENALLDLALMSAYLTAGGMGLIARLMYYTSQHAHFHLGILHVFLSLLLLILQTIHLVRHWKWIKNNFRTRIFARSIRDV